MSDVRLGFPVHGAMGRAALGWSVAGVWSGIATMLRAHASRRDLAAMDERMLADIGLSRAEATTEAARPLWDLAPPRQRWR